MCPGAILPPFPPTLFFPALWFFFRLHFLLLWTSLKLNALNQAGARSCPIAGNLLKISLPRTVRKHWRVRRTLGPSVRTCPSSTYSEKGPSGFPSSAEPSPQHHQHTPAWLRGKGARAWRRVLDWDAHQNDARPNKCRFFYARKCVTA